MMYALALLLAALPFDQALQQDQPARPLDGQYNGPLLHAVEQEASINGRHYERTLCQNRNGTWAHWGWWYEELPERWTDWGFSENEYERRRHNRIVSTRVVRARQVADPRALGLPVEGYGRFPVLVGGRIRVDVRTLPKVPWTPAPPRHPRRPPIPKPNLPPLEYDYEAAQREIDAIRSLLRSK